MTVSARALNVASFMSLIVLDHQKGTSPQPVAASSCLPSGSITVSTGFVGQTLYRALVFRAGWSAVSRKSRTSSSQVSL